MLVDDGIIFYDVDFGVGGQNGDFVYLVLLEVGIGDFYDAFFPYFMAAKVVADGDALVELVEAEEGHDVEKLVRGYMVYDGAVFEGGYLKLFLIV